MMNMAGNPVHEPENGKKRISTGVRRRKAHAMEHIKRKKNEELNDFLLEMAKEVHIRPSLLSTPPFLVQFYGRRVLKFPRFSNVSVRI